MAPLPTIEPVGLAAATLAVTVVLGTLSIITFALRIYVRASIKALALDDYLMAIGLVSENSTLKLKRLYIRTLHFKNW